ncbi:MAG: arginine kinase [Desulfobacteraceae bacterium]|nr:arginine kinase [Desulfobacteraceae bacterium]
MNKKDFNNISLSLAKKHLSKTIIKKLENKKTSSGYTLEHAIQSGVLNPDSEIGIYAGDEESYQIFSEIFDPVIGDYHSIIPDNQPVSNLSYSDISPLDPENKYIVSTRIRVARNLNKFPFPTFISTKKRQQVEQLIVNAIKKLPDNLQGEYLHLKRIIDSKSKLLKHNLFPKMGDRFQEAAGIMRDFPDARGVFLSNDKKFMIWINEEDHLRIISLDNGSDIAKTFNRLSCAIINLEKNLKFSFSKKYGYLTSCPSNVGISMRASVHIRLPKLDKQKKLLYQTAEQCKLQLRGTSGEKSNVEDSVFDISNKQRLGISEKDCLLILATGIKKLIELEEQI